MELLFIISSDVANIQLDSWLINYFHSERKRNCFCVILSMFHENILKASIHFSLIDGFDSSSWGLFVSNKQLVSFLQPLFFLLRFTAMYSKVSNTKVWQNYTLRNLLYSPKTSWSRLKTVCDQSGQTKRLDYLFKHSVIWVLGSTQLISMWL